jgi:hypothetical protein|tara:strand:+ start:730 stop:1497 length:768 start_codon:yes stop_codon:yes gene_type:complete
MTKYKRAEDVDTDAMSYSQEVTQTQEAAPDKPDDGWEKRYGDLRRHTQQQMIQKDQKIQEIRSQLDTAAKGQIKFPKTDEEIDVWSNKYPEVAKIVDTIARKRANEALEEGEKRLEGLKQLETKLTRKEAEQELVRMHPDFADIRQKRSFHEWVAMQPTYIQDALYKNNTNATEASRAIDLYKADMGKTKKSNPKNAASSVNRSSNSAPSTGGKARFSESQVARMSIDEYEKNEDAILDSMRTGGFVYDISGGAR